MNDILTVAGITAIISAIFTLVFQYFPGLKVRWAELNGELKRGIVLGVYVLVGAFVAFGGCFAVLANLIPQLLCVDAMTFGQYAIAVLFAIGAGQGFFNLAKSN